MTEARLDNSETARPRRREHQGSKPSPPTPVFAGTLWRRSALGLVLGLALVTTGCRDAGRRPEHPAGDPEVGTWPTWVLRSPAQITVPPPPAPDSTAANAEIMELRRLAQQPSAGAAELHRWTDSPPTERWMELSLDLVSGRTIDPPSAARAYALVSVAMYDAAVAAWHWQHRYQRAAPRVEGGLAKPGPDPSYPSEHAAIAGAASRMLAYLFPERPAATLERMAKEAADARVMAGANFPSDVTAGLELGLAVADAVIARARRDRSQRTWHGRPPNGPGFWQPPPGSDTPPLQPLARTWRTWVMRSGAQFRPAPPPRFGSPRYIAEARELLDLREDLTAEQKRIAKFWEGGVGTPLPPGVWNSVAMAYVRRDRLSTPRAARVFALLNVAMADTGVAVWDAKYTYWTTRPQNAIHDLGLDRNWKPFLATPPFPAYVSAHSAFSAAAGDVLAYLFPRDAAQFRAKTEEAGISRLYGGIHFRADHEAGLSLGHNIGQLIIDRRE
jgi:hypothetical protein